MVRGGDKDSTPHPLRIRLDGVLGILVIDENVQHIIQIKGGGGDWDPLRIRLDRVLGILVIDENVKHKN